MSLTSIGEIETASGETIASDDEARVQWYIDAVSAFIESYTGLEFNLHEDVTIRARADGKGMIEIANLIEITTVQERDAWTGVYGSLPYHYGSTGYAFDGIDTIYGLCPYESYQIVCSFGFEEVPADIAGVATQLVMAGAGIDNTAINGLKSYRVGDVEETYGVSQNETGFPVVSLSTLMSAVLNKYRHSFVYRL